MNKLKTGRYKNTTKGFKQTIYEDRTETTPRTGFRADAHLSKSYTSLSLKKQKIK